MDENKRWIDTVSWKNANDSQPRPLSGWRKKILFHVFCFAPSSDAFLDAVHRCSISLTLVMRSCCAIWPLSRGSRFASVCVWQPTRNLSLAKKYKQNKRRLCASFFAFLSLFLPRSLAVPVSSSYFTKARQEITACRERRTKFPPKEQTKQKWKKKRLKRWRNRIASSRSLLRHLPIIMMMIPPNFD